MNKTAFAIKVPFEDGWLLVQTSSKHNGRSYETMTFEDIKAARNAAQAWKKYEIVELVYNEDKEEYEESI